MGEIVLGTSRAEHDHGGSHAQRWHGHHGENHPVGPCVFWVHAEQLAVVVGDSFEDLEYELGWDVHLLVLGRVVHLFPFRSQLETLASNLRLIAAAAFCDFRRILIRIFLTTVTCFFRLRKLILAEVLRLKGNFFPSFFNQIINFQLTLHMS